MLFLLKTIILSLIFYFKLTRLQNLHAMMIVRVVYVASFTLYSIMYIYVHFTFIYLYNVQHMFDLFLCYGFILFLFYFFVSFPVRFRSSPSPLPRKLPRFVDDLNSSCNRTHFLHCIFPHLFSSYFFVGFRDVADALPCRLDGFSCSCCGSFLIYLTCVEVPNQRSISLWTQTYVV